MDQAAGILEFMRREAVLRAYGTDGWPLYLMSSSQAGTESLVAGLWSSWFKTLGAQLAAAAGPSLTVAGLFAAAEAAFYQENLYELANATKARVYAPTVWQLQSSTLAGDLESAGGQEQGAVTRGTSILCGRCLRWPDTFAATNHQAAR